MPKFIDLTNKTFGRLLVIKTARNNSGVLGWVCKCSCGNKCWTRGAELTRGCTKSCGCLRAELMKNLGKRRTGKDNNKYKHGLFGTKEYYTKIIWKYRLLSKFGITEPEYNAKLIKQKNKCAICGTLQEKIKIRLCVDHNHKTGQVRGLLCRECNFMIGRSKESIAILNKAIKYLTKWNTKSK
jgi:hypothetical protein